MQLSVRRLGGRVVAAAAVAVVAILVMGKLGGGGGDVRWQIDLAPAGEVRSVEVTITGGDQVLAVHQQVGGRAVRLTTPAPKGRAKVTIDLILPDGPHRVVREADAPAGATVAITVGE
ncbi:MAG: hypothetical protein IPL61_18855 [Myxococcales bacterium]|nr:hypothetical protein [Myxococcales bacterium]